MLRSRIMGDDACAMPFGEELGVRVVEDGEECATCELTVADRHLNQGLLAHGGVLFALADTALGLLANRAPDGPTWVGTSFHLQLHRGARPGDLVRACARIEHGSRRLRTCRVELTVDERPAGFMVNQLLQTSPAAGEPVGREGLSVRLAAPGEALVRAMEAGRRRVAAADRDVPPPRASRPVVVEHDAVPHAYAVVVVGAQAPVWDVWMPAHVRTPAAEAVVREAIGAQLASGPVPSPARPVAGGCLCGAVRYVVTAPFLRAGHCHCSRCRRHSGASASTQGRVPATGFSLRAGADALRTFRPPGGMAKAFCVHCGSSLFGGTWPDGDEVSIRFGTLDDDPQIRPAFHTFVADRPAWDAAPSDGLPTHDGPLGA